MLRNWLAEWIGTDSSDSPWFRKEFNLSAKPAKAECFLCGLGFHELYVNGEKADSRVLAPAPAQYDKHLPYVNYDLTGHLKAGKNCLVIWLGNGLFNAAKENVWRFDEAPWHDTPRLLCELEVDGKLIIGSDETWRSHASPIIYNSLYCGEKYDARLDMPEIFHPEFDDSSWNNAEKVNAPSGILFEENIEPTTAVKVIPPVRHIKTQLNKTSYDFGVNISGWCRLKVSGPKGSMITIRHNERLRDNGQLDAQHNAQHLVNGEFQVDRYILKGDGTVEYYEPRFTYHGFQYAEVELGVEKGYLHAPSDILIHSIEAVFIHTALEQTGRFSCGEPVLNGLQKNTIQSYLSNFVGIPTDCPHREKNGWTGDVQLALETGLWNFNAHKAYLNFLQIVVDTQKDNGQLCAIAPTGGWGYDSGGPPWDALLFEIPWQLWRFYGDNHAIVKYYPNMQKYLSYCQTQAVDNLVKFGLCDWCHPLGREYHLVASSGECSSFYYYYMCRLMTKFAAMKKQAEDQKFYYDLSENIRRAFIAEYFSRENRLTVLPWTTLAAIVYFEMTEAEDRPEIVKALVERIRNNSHKVEFGILGAKFIPRVLADYGYAADALKLITQTEFPGWGYQLSCGATTLWEDWYGVSSRNHIMFGDISAWMYQYVGGIIPNEVNGGFQHFTVAPKLLAQIPSAKVSHRSTAGTIEVKWQRRNGMIQFSCRIPVKSTANIIIGKKVISSATGNVKLEFCERALE